MSRLKLRPEVEAFAQLMERALRENDDKGGWDRCSNGYLQTRLHQEVEELAEALPGPLGWRCMEDRGDIPISTRIRALGAEAAVAVARLALESMPCRCSSSNNLFAGTLKCDPCTRLAELKEGR